MRVNLIINQQGIIHAIGRNKKECIDDFNFAMTPVLVPNKLNIKMFDPYSGNLIDKKGMPAGESGFLKNSIWRWKLINAIVEINDIEEGIIKIQEKIRMKI